MNTAKKQNRIVSLDMLRGFALLGILTANMAVFKSPAFQLQSIPGVSPSFPSDMLDKGVTFMIDWLVIGKFYPLFSFLFGIGFFLFYETLKEKEMNAERLYKRRLAFLMAAGLVHLVFLWSGDILHTYAAAGLLLLPFIHRRSRTVLTWAVLLLVTTSLFTSFLTISGNFYAASGSGYTEQALAGAAKAEDVYSSGSYSDILRYRLDEEIPLVLSNLVLNVPQILGLFLIGLYVGKKGHVQRADKHLKGWKKTMIFMLSAGGLLSFLYAALLHGLLPLPLWLADGAAQGINMIAGPLLMLGYTSFFVIITQKRRFSTFLQPIAAAGRMALTNYLLQTVICLLLFYGFGLQLFGTMGAASGFLITLVIFSTQTAFSYLWLTYYSHGPMEKLWRLWIYRPFR
ncbi:DUF418 domain-containing protein [Salibacterium halotolerans]|uniref:DUF418 domain-containing protein n=1 Tax=Salibacterium halotolerans TaxID=1884432 RepID=A0A1I5SW81_9BACI|nr:DUF418 domain-containing protein [Salibacterium halotolerans]SFP74999.1 uncharacterized protein SAMN05518683_109120 [Salibacterium halotolerans]